MKNIRDSIIVIDEKIYDKIINPNGSKYEPPRVKRQKKISKELVAKIIAELPDLIRKFDKNKQYFFVIVKVVILPENPNNYDVIWMESFKKHARDKDAKVLYAGVGLGNPNGEDLPIYLNEDYLIEYNGIQVVETNLN